MVTKAVSSERDCFGNLVSARQSQIRDHRAGLAKWLARFEWKHFVTFTFSADQSFESATRCFRTLVRRLEQRAQKSVNWFRTIERGSSGGRVHIHALIAGTEGLSNEALAATWKHGRSSVETYDRSKGGARYTTKLVGSGNVEYDLSSNLPATLDH